ncbi:MAG: VanZ family protein [Lachnospiraceae bacterium]|nr:VanZ family protein [Lachnospiraceae bacterium]
MRKLLSAMPVGLASFVVLVAVLYLTLYPNPLPENDIPLFPGADKVVHALMMFGLSGCVAYDYMRSRYGKDKMTPPKGMLLCLLALTTLFGGVIELLQSWMDVGRSEDILDFVADAAGAIVAFVVELLFWSRLRRWLTER